MIQKLGYYRQTPNPPLFHTLGKINKPRLVTELNYFRLRNTESGEDLSPEMRSSLLLRHES